MRRKIICVAIMFVICMFFIFNIKATETSTQNLPFFSVNTYEDLYKLSEQQDKIQVPFLNIFSQKAVYDELVNSSGISIGNNIIEVTEKLSGFHFIMCNDMVEVKGEIETGIIYANNVVIEGVVSRDTFILGKNVTITSDANIKANVIIVANELELAGTVDNNVLAVVSDNAKISGTIKKDLRIITGNIDVTDSNIEGNVYIKTDSNTDSLKAKYEDAKIFTLKQEENKKDTTKDILNVIIKGIITVVVYTTICYLLTRKEENIVSRAKERFKAHPIYGILMSCVYFLLILILPILLILMMIINLGVVAWPIFIAYFAVLFISIATSSLVVGMVIYESIKAKVSSWKIPAMALIFLVLFVLVNIPFIAKYVVISINLIALAIIITYITRKEKNVQN